MLGLALPAERAQTVLRLDQRVELGDADPVPPTQVVLPRRAVVRILLSRPRSVWQGLQYAVSPSDAARFLPNSALAFSI